MTLTPEFATATHEYSAATTNASNKVTATILDEERDTLTIEANGTEIESGDSVTWEEGENEVVLTVTDSYAGTEIVYTVTVTKTTPEPVEE